MRTLLTCLTLILVCQQCVPVTPYQASQATLQYDNIAYSSTIKSAALYPLNSKDPFLQPATLTLNQGDRLRLEFDDLATDYVNYVAKVFHCNADWTKSSLRDMEFMVDYNEFPLLQWAYSSNSRVPYIHYTLDVPPVKISGNFVIGIFRDGNLQQPVLTHRFMVAENRVGLSPELERSMIPGEREVMQRISFTVNYQSLDAPNPSGQFKVVVRQNRRWDRTLSPPPTQIREAQKKLVFSPLDGQLDFPGGNEFRWFETRSVNFPGQNVSNIVLAREKVSGFVLPEKSRGGLAYGQIPDLNGAYRPRISGDLGMTEGEYIETNFLFNSDSLPGDLYVLGAFNQWTRNSNSRMSYSAKDKGYVGMQLLKQGWYNYEYTYVAESEETWAMEGSHFSTENNYDIMVYFRPLGSLQDLLVGYSWINVNEN